MPSTDIFTNLKKYVDLKIMDFENRFGKFTKSIEKQIKYFFDSTKKNIDAENKKNIDILNNKIKELQKLIIENGELHKTMSDINDNIVSTSTKISAEILNNLKADEEFLKAISDKVLQDLMVD